MTGKLGEVKSRERTAAPTRQPSRRLIPHVAGQRFSYSILVKFEQ